MALIICPECGKEFSDRAPACPKCGCPTDEMYFDEEVECFEEDYLDDEDDEDEGEAPTKEKKGFWGTMIEMQKEADRYQLEKSQRPKEIKSKGGLKCPKCKGHNIDLWSNTANMKVKQKTSLNLNPLHPLTIVNTKEVKKEKKSAAKIGLAMMTGGTSLLVTGTHNKKHNEYYCKDCGHRWIGK